MWILGGSGKCTHPHRHTTSLSYHCFCPCLVLDAWYFMLSFSVPVQWKIWRSSCIHPLTISSNVSGLERSNKLHSRILESSYVRVHTCICESTQIFQFISDVEWRFLGDVSRVERSHELHSRMPICKPIVTHNLTHT